MNYKLSEFIDVLQDILDKEGEMEVARMLESESGDEFSITMDVPVSVQTLPPGSLHKRVLAIGWDD